MASPRSKITSSCSPLPSRPTNPRKFEVGNPMRRSFSGNPFAKPSIIPNQTHGFNPNTPANSPSDHPRKNSVGRENLVVSFRDQEDKENSKDQKSKQCSVRSPSSSKGAKNFMSPTVSAASKINASPRKKILTERNDSVRSSVDGTGPLKENLEFKPEKSLNLKKEVSFSPKITYLEDKEEELLNSFEDLNSKSVAAENDLVNLDSSSEISPRASISLPSPALAPALLDADPSMPPYDLNTNFTSPRPQFLHYKPKPIVEMYLKQRDGKPLEESFAYESSSDEQETDSEESSLDSPDESEDVSSGNVMTEEEEEEKEEQEAAEQIVLKPRKVNQRHFLMRPKFTALMFVLALAGVWAFVCHSPAMELSVLDNSNFLLMYLPPEISEITVENLEGLAQKFRQLLYESISCIHKLVIGFIELQNPGQLQFANLTTLLESTVDSYPLVDHNPFIAEVVYERKGQPIEAGLTFEQGPAIQQPFQNEDDELFDEFEEGYNNDADGSYGEGADGESEESEHEKAIAVPENEADERAKEVADGKGEESTHEEAIVVPESFEALETVTAPESIAEKSIAIVSGAETEPELSSLHSPSAENAISPIESESTMADSNSVEQQTMAGFISESFEPEDAATVEQQIAGSEDALSRQAMTGLSLLIVSSLIAVVSFVYMKNRTSGTLNASTSADQITKKVMSANTGNTVQERSCSRHWQEEVETIGESCPSEMSSFHYSSSYSKQERGESEAKSQEKRRPRSSSRRESLASSDCSMGSASYGSFTTYEKVQIKLGKGEEEFVTPVRRSSRIRKQVMSP